jgi:hypothetical protein
MRLPFTVALAGVVAAFTVTTSTAFRVESAPRQAGPTKPINLAERLSAGKLRVVNRTASPTEGRSDAIHLDERPGSGVAWVEGTDFVQGTIEVEIRGRDVFQQSFVGVAFHRRDDETYEAVYLRPFNFRAQDPARHQHAVQYVSVPEFDWPQLRKHFPEEFENPVDATVTPTGWVPVRLVVDAKTIQIYVGAVKTPTLEVRKLGALERGAVGLWAGNGSDGDFADLRLTPAR